MRQSTDNSFLSEEQQLLLAVASGDERAFEVLYYRFSKKIYYFAFKFLQEEMAAEEVVQEVMLKIWRNRDTLGTIKHLESYLRVLSRNIALNALRRLAIEDRANEKLKLYANIESNETEERVILQETKKLLAQAIAQLPPQQREVYKLCHQQGLKYEEAAQQLHLSPATVATHMKLALRFLRTYLKQHGHFVVICIIFKLI
jgi:RNA polymerase sigma-70 factor (ECF subfamily)